MKNNNRQRFLAILTFIALATLLSVQVYWLFKAALLEEKNFNQQVNKALTEARKEIGNKLTNCDDMKNYLSGNPCIQSVQQKKIAELDSIIKSKLEIHHIDLAYTFNVIADSTINSNHTNLFANKCYVQSLNGVLEKNGIQISLQFPGRNQFLIAQIRGAFLLAFIAVFFVMFSFVITFAMFRKERQMAQHTSDFINNMVHEFQTPLSNIKLAASLIKKKEKAILDEKVIDYLTVIQNENLKLEKHVEEILKVASPLNNHTQHETVNVHHLIEATMHDFKTRLEGEKGKFELHLNASRYLIEAAPVHIKLILSNLIDNGIKYTVNAPHIVITTSNYDNEFVMKVKDNGIGIDKKNFANIFEKYFRVSTGDIHNVKGFGLGLTYVKKLTEQYKGKIEVESSKTSGTIFTVFLPLKNEANKNTIG
jgi:two-component system phosphate regulon sensor histidine kinase PhoR